MNSFLTTEEFVSAALLSNCDSVKDAIDLEHHKALTNDTIGEWFDLSLEASNGRYIVM